MNFYLYGNGYKIRVNMPRGQRHYNDESTQLLIDDADLRIDTLKALGFLWDLQ